MPKFTFFPLALLLICIHVFADQSTKKVQYCRLNSDDLLDVIEIYHSQSIQNKEGFGDCYKSVVIIRASTGIEWEPIFIYEHYDLHKNSLLAAAYDKDDDGRQEIYIGSHSFGGSGYTTSVRVYKHIAKSNSLKLLAEKHFRNQQFHDVYKNI